MPFIPFERVKNDTIAREGRERDWNTQFTTYYIRAMTRNADGNSFNADSYNSHGRIRDDNNWGHHKAIGGHPTFVNSMGTLTMTPSIFSPRPVAKAGVGTLTQGC